MPIEFLEAEPSAPAAGRIQFLDEDEVVYREDTNTALTAPSGLDAAPIEYLDDVQNRGKSKGNFFGYIDVGDPIDVAKGFMRSKITTGVNLATLDKPLLEKRLADIETAGREFSAWDLLTQFKPLSSDGRMAQIRVSEKFGGGLTFDKEKKMLQERLATMGGIRKKEGAVMKGMGLGVGADGNTETVLSMVGTGAENISTLWGLQRITGNAKLFSATMGASTKSSSYEQAREAGLSIDDADQSSNLRAAIQTGSEYIGTETLFKAIGGSSIMRRVLKGWLTEGAEEGVAQIGDILVSNGYNITDIGPKEGVFQTLLAAGIGAISTTPLSVMMKSDPPSLEQLAKRLKMKPEDVLKMVENTERAALEDGPLKDGINTAISQAVEQEVGDIRTSDRADEEAATVKIMQDFVDGKEIDITGLPPDVQEMINSRAEMRVPVVEKVDSLQEDGKPKISLESTDEEIATFYPAAKKIVDGLSVMDDVPNVGSISASLNNYEVLSGIREVPFSFFNGADRETPRTRKLKEEIQASGEIKPLIVVVDSEGPYILEGAHRYDALQHAGKKSFPAMVVLDLDSLPETTQKNDKTPTAPQSAAVIPIEAGGKAMFAGAEYPIVSVDEKTGRAVIYADENNAQGGVPGERLVRISDLTPTARNPVNAALEPASGGSSNNPPPTPDITETPEPERDTEADYEAVANQTQGSALIEDAGGVLKDARHLAADAFVPVSSRAGRISQELKHAIRKFVFNTGLYTTQDQATIKPFITKVSNSFDERDYRIFDLALKNRDLKKIDELVAKYGIEKDWKSVRSVLDDLYTEAKDVGLDMSYIPDYFPRKVQRDRVSEYMAWIRGQEEWSDIQLAMDKADPAKSFTPDEQAEFVNNYLRGFSSNKLNLSKLGMTKKRSVDYVTPEANEFYQDSMPTLIEYISGVRHAIEARRLFGFSEKDTDINIGKYVLSLVEEGSITRDQEKEVATILKAVVEPTGTRGAVTWAKNASYIYLMGSPISAITQIQDLAFSMYRNGYYQTTRSLLRSLTGNAIVNKEDIGIENVLQEFEGNSRTSEAVKGVFRAVGLSWMDNIGKETLMDAAYSNLRKAAKGDNQKFNDMIDAVFGDEAAQTKQDLIDGNVSENVKYLLFSELSDFQPISLAEMPVGYLRGGNGRIFYMLKTYTIKQIDIYRREIFDEIGSGDPIRAVSGLRNLTKLAFAMMLMGMGSDALKDLLLGREIETDDLVTDNIMKLFGFTKYQIYKARDEGIANAFWKTLFVPPVGAPVDDLYKDISKIGFGDKELKDSEIAGKVPLIGKFYYWWYGGGRTKLDDAEGDAGKF